MKKAKLNRTYVKYGGQVGMGLMLHPKRVCFPQRFDMGETIRFPVLLIPFMGLINQPDPVITLN